MYRIFAENKSGTRKYYYTGKVFITDIAKAKSYPGGVAGKKAVKKIIVKYKHKIPNGFSLHYKETHPLTKMKRKKNPAGNVTNKKIAKAIRLFEEFSGHTPEYIDKKDLPKIDVGFKIGTLDGLLYTTVRDGRTEKYVHKFKRRARPILVSNFDGSFIALVGGNYKFTDRGIVDN